MEPKEDRRVEVRLPPELLERLDAAALVDQRDRASAIRIAIVRYVDGIEARRAPESGR